MRAIYCPGPERWMSLRHYVWAIRLAKANPDKGFKTGLTCWWPCTGADIVRQFGEGMMQRINDAVPYTKRGLRKSQVNRKAGW